MAYLTLCANHVSRVEATFRIAFNGGVRLFSKQGDELCIRSLHFDGHEHYSRRLNLRRILRDMKTPAEGIEIPDDVALDDAPSDHRKANCQAYDDCQLLQLTDILVSGFRTVLAKSGIVVERVSATVDGIKGFASVKGELKTKSGNSGISRYR
jgi:hypothetical protein